MVIMDKSLSFPTYTEDFDQEISINTTAVKATGPHYDILEFVTI